MFGNKVDLDRPSLSERVRSAEIRLRLIFERIPTWLILTSAIVSPIFLVAGALPWRSYGMIAIIVELLVCGAVLFIALSYCQLLTRIVVTLAYECYLILASGYLLLVGSCMLFGECV
jgi:hypothetical protein